MATAQDGKRRRVTADGQRSGGYAGNTLGGLLEHLELSAPSVQLVVLDALGAPLTDRGEALDQAAEALTCTAAGAFVARLEGLAGFSLESGEMDLDGIDDADLEVLGDEQMEITVVPCDVAAAANSTAGAGAPDGDHDGGGSGSGNRSRAHELLTSRARKVFDDAMKVPGVTGGTVGGGGGGEGGFISGGGGSGGHIGEESEAGGVGLTGGGSGGDGARADARRRQLRALEAMVLWLNAHADVFSAGDPSNDGRIMARDPAGGGVLVPARLLHA